MRIRKRVTASKKNRPVKASTRLARARKLRNVCSSASGAKYAPIINRDLDYFENDVERYIGKKAPILRKWLEDQDFVLDEMSGPAKDSAWESWRLDTEAGNIMVVFYFDLIPSGKAGRLNEGKITKAYVEDNQDNNAIMDEESRLFSSSKIRKRKVSASKRTAKRPVMAGAGGGITIKLRSIDFENIPNGGFYPEYNQYHDFLEPENGFCIGTIEFASIGTYYYGGNPGLGDVTVDIQVVSAEPNGEEDVQDIVDASLKDVIYDISDIEEVSLGGGYTHTTFNGQFEAEVYCSGYYCTLKLKITIPDKDLVEWLDAFAHGDNEVIEYDIIINGDPVGNPTENKEEAIEWAKRTADDYDPEETEVGVVMNHYTYGYDGDIDQYFDDDGDVIWRNNDYLYD